MSNSDLLLGGQGVFAMLKWRLFLGGLMILLLAVLLAVDVLSVGSDGQFWGSWLICQGLIPVALVCAVACVASGEVLSLGQVGQLRYQRLLAMIAVMVIAGQPLLADLWPNAIPTRAGLIAMAVMAAWAVQLAGRRTEGSIGDLGWTTLTIIYAGLLASYASGIRVDFGPVHFIFLLAVVKGGDIGAYFTGLAVGRHKLIAWLSPGKTWEGFIGALVAGGAIGGAVSYFACFSQVARFDISVPTAAVLGVLAAGAGHLGDLAESLLKRAAGRKDSARLLPAFGGALDLADSVVFAAPVMYLFFRIVSEYNIGCY